MDLLRRRPAGELAELLGAGLVATDTAMRRHGLRRVAEQALARLDPAQRALLDAYAEGVDAGLRTLGARPVEYLLLRSEPTPWRPEDSLLVIAGMFAELQDASAEIEADLGVMHAALPQPLYDFLTPEGGAWDAPLLGPSFADPPIPSAEQLGPSALPRVATLHAPRSDGVEMLAASNSWAVAGAHAAAGGRALVANDMHLRLAVPNVWYRAVFVWPSESAGAGGRRLVGATLPGTPLVAIGSNGDVAWSLTNSWIDVSDLVLVERDPADPERYLTPDGPEAFEHRRETIRVRGGGVQSAEVIATRWGPVIGSDPSGRPLALRWVAQEPAAIDLGFVAMEEAQTVEQALLAAQRSGMPALNLVVGDDEGHIGWTLTGKLPRRVGHDGRLPSSWADGSRSWNGWLFPEEVPRVVDPASGRLWTANNRLVDGEELRRLGDGGYYLGARARQVRDGLLALEHPGVAELLALQLDDRALFYERWRGSMLRLLGPEAIAADPRRRELRALLESWDGRASVDSVAFRAVRTYRNVLAENLFDQLTAPCRERDADFHYKPELTRQLEGPLWRLVSEQPAHLLDPDYPSWDALLLAAVDLVLDDATAGGGRLADYTWGAFNRMRIRHPLSRGLPWLGRWLDLPVVALPGADQLPRLQTPGAGASQRMVVAPGREEEGIFHMPGGQSGHPFSAHYRDGHAAWVAGEPTPLLPGVAVNALTLQPDREPSREHQP